MWLAKLVAVKGTAVSLKQYSLSVTVGAGGSGFAVTCHTPVDVVAVVLHVPSLANLLYVVVVVNPVGGSYVAALLLAISIRSEKFPIIDDCHLYVIDPSPPLDAVALPINPGLPL